MSVKIWTTGMLWIAQKITGAVVPDEFVAIDDYNRLREALEKMITREPVGFVTHEVAVMQDIARAALQEDGDE